MKVGIEYIKGKFDNRINYIVKFINLHPLNPGIIFLENTKEKLDQTILYSEKPKKAEQNKIGIKRANKIFSTTKHISSELFINTYWNGNSKVFSVETEEREKHNFIENDVIQFDLIETIFFHITRYEEYEKSNLNEWEMFKEESQLLVRNNLEQIPVVDMLLFSFFSFFKNIKEKKSEIKVSHDIDHIRKFNSRWSSLKKLGGHIYRNELKLIPNYLKQLKEYWATKLDPYDVFDKLLTTKNIEKEIYFLVGGKHKFDTPISLEDEITKNSFKLAKERGYRIGIHPSYDSWENSNLILQEKNKLSKDSKTEITISRQHYLRFSLPGTINSLLKAGIKSDSSIGYNKRIGFRSGTGFKYILYNLEEDCESGLEVQPLIFMDSAFLFQCKSEQQNHILHFSDFIKRNSWNTMLSFNFHNSRFEECDIAGIPLWEIYNQVLEF